MSVVIHRKRVIPKFRTNVVHWWGVLSYRKLKVTIENRLMLCPLCQHELKEGVYSGHEKINTTRNTFGYVRDCWMPEKEDGLVVWKVVENSC